MRKETKIMAATKKPAKASSAKTKKAAPKKAVKKTKAPAKKAAVASEAVDTTGLDRKGLSARARQIKTELLAIRFNIQSPNLNEYRKKRRELASLLAQLG